MADAPKRALDKVRERFKEIERQSLYVPEWDLEIWFSPYTIADSREIASAVDANRPESGPESFAHVLVRKAEDRNGDKLFSTGEIYELIRLGESTLINAIAQRIMVSQGDAMTPGKSEQTPT